MREGNTHEYVLEIPAVLKGGILKRKKKVFDREVWQEEKDVVAVYLFLT
jgi:hypothetical protein